jgi:hypothetical protein
MTIDLETAVQTLVCVAMGQHPSKRVTVGLIVAVLARKFSAVTEDDIRKLVTRTVVNEGGTVDLLDPAAGPSADPVPVMQLT